MCYRMCEVCVILGNTELTCVIECVGVCVILCNTELTCVTECVRFVLSWAIQNLHVL